VVDADTKQPVPGAIVLVSWDLEGGMERSRLSHNRTLQLFETVTDQAGRFRIPGWGPIERPRQGLLARYDPQILVFVTPYAPSVFSNDDPKLYWNLPDQPPSPPYTTPQQRERLETHDSKWNGRTFALKRFYGEPEAYSHALVSVEFTINDWINNGSGCRWKQLPRTLRVLADEEARERAAGIGPRFHVSLDLPFARSKCAPTDEFMKAYREAQ
jgi:hypothetical protein